MSIYKETKGKIKARFLYFIESIERATKTTKNQVGVITEKLSTCKDKKSKI
jgi:hypothetical protein